MESENMMFGVVTIFIVAIVVIIFAAIIDTKQKERIREDIYTSKFLYYKEFENRWIISSGSGKYGTRTGFKYEDGCGCYVIEIYTHPVENNEWKDYENIYIGQSLKVCQRVHNHLTGKGNGDVYAYIKNGKYVYVSFVKCTESEMNSMEKNLFLLLMQHLHIIKQKVDQ